MIQPCCKITKGALRYINKHVDVIVRYELGSKAKLDLVWPPPSRHKVTTTAEEEGLS